MLVSALALTVVAFTYAEEEEVAIPAEDPELTAEIAYAEALVGQGFPDFADEVIKGIKRRWPDAEAKVFAIEVRGLLSFGKFEEAERKIAALPERKGPKYWRARLEVANNYFARNQKDACVKIYDEFFAAYPKANAEIGDFYLDASYMFGQLLFSDRKYAEAAKRYEASLPLVPPDRWCNMASETVKMYMKAYEAVGKGKGDTLLVGAERIVDKLLYRLDEPVFFGQAISMKAHIAELRGKIDLAKEFIDEYKPQLEDIHAQIIEYDPDGKLGVLRLSPLPECLYLQGKILWNAAQEEYRNSPRDDEKVKAYLFGARDKATGKRDGQGAFNMAVNVFIKYETSPWAVSAGEMSEQIREFAEKNYHAKIKTKITQEQLDKMRLAQFKQAHELFLANKYVEAVQSYFEVLERYPELMESVKCLGNIISALQDLCVEEQDANKRAEYRLDCDTIEGYVAERFAGNPNRELMLTAGNVVLAAANTEKERKEPERAKWLYELFYQNYTDNPTAPMHAANSAMEAQKLKDYGEAIRLWGFIEQIYTNSAVYASALAQLSYCHGELGHRREEIDYISRYLPLEEVKIRRLQAQTRLAQMYQRDGLDILASADTNETEQAVAAAEARGSAQIIRAIKQFTEFAAEAERAIADPGTPKNDVEKYRELHEAALYFVGDCWIRMTRPAARLEMMRKKAAESYEKYVAAYPQGKSVRSALVRLGTVYTALGDLAQSKSALDRLAKAFPDSDEAKNAKPRLAKNLMELGMTREATEIYAEMLKTDGKYTAGQFLAAGDALINGKSWELANQAFSAAIRLAGTNQLITVAKARLGEARCAFRQSSYAEAREALDLFLQDPKMAKLAMASDAYFMMAEVASEQGRLEQDKELRGKCFGSAVGALRKVRAYWAKKPQWEQDQLDLLSGDILRRRMEAELAMGLEEDAAETCGRAASTFQVFIQAHAPSESHPFADFAEGERENLERAYASMLPLLGKQGAEQASQVMRFGNEYLKLFPEGRNRTLVLNCINQAKVDLPAAEAQADSASSPEAGISKEED